MATQGWAGMNRKWIQWHSIRLMVMTPTVNLYMLTNARLVTIYVTSDIRNSVNAPTRIRRTQRDQNKLSVKFRCNQLNGPNLKLKTWSTSCALPHPHTLTTQIANEATPSSDVPISYFHFISRSSFDAKRRVTCVLKGNWSSVVVSCDLREERARIQRSIFVYLSDRRCNQCHSRCITNKRHHFDIFARCLPTPSNLQLTDV